MRVICQVRWINTILGWMWQRCPAAGPGTTRPDVVESWLRAMTDEADKQAVQLIDLVASSMLRLY